VHIPFLLVPLLVTAEGLNGPAESDWLVAALIVAIAALQLRHSFAAARGEQPKLWPLTLTALGLLVVVPLPWFGLDWGTSAWFLSASAAMLLAGSLRLAFFAVPVAGISLWSALSWVLTDHATVPTDVWSFFYWAVSLSGGAVCLYGAAHLVRAVDELFATRAELAASVIGRERGRLSRDLHDLLGQSLSAVSLKGDLALALMRSGSRAAAEEEIRGLTELAREALHHIRDVVRDQYPISLSAQTRGASALLAAAGIDAQIDARVENLSRPVDELLGWATREAVANMLRHSQASTCSIRATRNNGDIVLEIINDGAGPPSPSGSGISGLSERAQTLGGSVTAGQLAEGRFRLLVQVPEAIT
jgi:two-component system sensor histidine kinase DesK